MENIRNELGIPAAEACRYALSQMPTKSADVWERLLGGETVGQVAATLCLSDEDAEAARVAGLEVLKNIGCVQFY